jgi:hypothetical protein
MLIRFEEQIFDRRRGALLGNTYVNSVYRVSKNLRFDHTAIVIRVRATVVGSMHSRTSPAGCRILRQIIFDFWSEVCAGALALPLSQILKWFRERPKSRNVGVRVPYFRFLKAVGGTPVRSEDGVHVAQVKALWLVPRPRPLSRAGKKSWMSCHLHRHQEGPVKGNPAS